MAELEEVRGSPSILFDHAGIKDTGFQSGFKWSNKMEEGLNIHHFHSGERV